MVPEVTFCAGGLERAARAAQAVRMSPRLKMLLSPLNLAAYLAWGGIGWELLATTPRLSALAAGLPAKPLLVAMHVAFLLLFCWVVSHEGQLPRPSRARGLVVLQFALAFAMMSLSASSTLPILLILCAVQVVHLWPPRLALAIILAADVGLYLVYAEVWHYRSALFSTMMHASFQGFAALTAWFGLNAERARDALASTHADLLATRSLLAESARDGERLRLSRELHDVAGHKLTALKLNLAALARDPRFAGEAQLALCARLADELLGDLRGVVSQMRRGDGVELAGAIEALASPYPRPRLHLEVDPGLRVAGLAPAEAVLRAVQEGLTNAARHSQAQNLWVVLRRDGDALRLDIRDDGRGRGELRAGNGLGGMRERLEAIGGGLSVQRTDTGGVHLQAWLPGAA